MSADDDLTKKVEMYQAVAKENPNVDVGMLMLNALATEKQNRVSSKVKKWAYLISISAPPLGLLFSLKYFFSDESDAREVAWTCVILTILAIGILWISIKLFFSGSGASVQQIEQIKPSDALQLLQ
jgi:hypothetical protein